MHTIATNWWLDCNIKYAIQTVKKVANTARKSSRRGGRVWSKSEPPLSEPNVSGDNMQKT